MKKETLTSHNAPAEAMRHNGPKIQNEIDSHNGLEFRFHEADRFVTFTDAVVAIAMTLLILPLIDSASEVDEDEGYFLLENQSKVGLFFLSFFLIAILWVNHDYTTRYIGCFTLPMVCLNFVWMAGIVFIPIGSSMLHTSKHQTIKYILYIVPMIVSSLVNFLMCVIVRCDKRTLKGNKCPGALYLVQYGIVACLLVIVMLIGIFVPYELGGALAAFLLVLYPVLVNFVGRIFPNLTREQSVE